MVSRNRIVRIVKTVQIIGPSLKVCSDRKSEIKPVYAVALLLPIRRS